MGKMDELEKVYVHRPHSNQVVKNAFTWAGAIVGLIIAYLLSEKLLTSPMYSIHWITAIAGATLGYLVGLFLALIKLANNVRE